MRKIFTLAFIMSMFIIGNAQIRSGKRLYWNPQVPSATYNVNGLSGPSSGGNYKFTDSTQWYYQSGASYVMLSTESLTNRVILSTDTLVINNHNLSVNVTVTLPANVKYLILGDPDLNSGSTLEIASGKTLTFSNTSSAFSVSANGYFTLHRAKDAVSPTVLKLGNTIKAINNSIGGPIFSSGSQMSGVPNLGVTAYALNSTVANSLTPLAGFTQLGTLPVVLMSFDAVKYNSGVSLKWSTQQEFNTQVFHVERSSNGLVYTKIGSVLASGNSTVTSEYSFNDPTPVTGIVYYRIKIYDLDGKMGLTTVKAVRGTTSSVKVGIYPNPAATHANVLVNAAPNNPFTIAVYNQQGMLVGSQAPNTGNATQVDLSRYTSGQYIIEVRFADGSRQTEKLMVVKN